MKLFFKTALALTALCLPVPKVTQSGPDAPQHRLDRDSAAYFQSLGEAEEAARRPNSALHFYERAARFDPEDTSILQHIVGVAARLNKDAKALAAMESLQAIRPKNGEGARALAQAYFSRQDWTLAAQWATRAEALSPGAPGMQYVAGVAFYHQRDYGAALPHLRRAVEAEPSRADAHYYIARLFVQQGAYARSVPHYEKTIALDGTKPMRAYELALALSAAGKAEESIAWFSKALEMGYEAKDDFYTNMAYALADAKQTKQAIVTLKGVLQRRPEDQNILFALAEMTYSAGNYKEAIRYWDDVLKLDKGHARALFMIGKSYLAMGKTSEGQQLCDRAIQMDPSLASLRQKRFLFQ